MKIRHLKELLATVDDDADLMIVVTKTIPENERNSIYPYPSEHTTYTVDEDAWEKHTVQTLRPSEST